MLASLGSMGTSETPSTHVVGMCVPFLWGGGASRAGLELVLALMLVIRTQAVSPGSSPLPPLLARLASGLKAV